MDTTPEPLPLVIGVTGHRDLSGDTTELETAVGSVFRRLHADYLEAQGRTPIIVLTPLTEGAGRLVARVAHQHGAQVIAPMPNEKFRQDLEQRAGTSEECDEWRAFRKPMVPPAPAGSIGAARGDRDYYAVDLFIVRHCDILIALWDGNAAEPAAGEPAHMVDLKLNGIPLPDSASARASLDAPEIGPVIHIVTPRATSAAPAAPVSVKPWGKAFVAQSHAQLAAIEQQHAPHHDEKAKRDAEAEAIKRDVGRWTSFKALIEVTGQFNKETKRLFATKKRRQKPGKSLDQLFERSDRTCDADARDAAVALARRWCKLYAAADALAQRWQWWFKADWGLLFVLGFAAIAFFEMFAHLAPVGEYFIDARFLPMIDTVLIGGYVVTFSVVYAVFLYARNKHHQEQFLDYRALAEALRVAAYWKLNGIGSIADTYPIKLPRELAWVKTCLLNLELLDIADEAPTASPDPRSYGWTRNLWINGQFLYFRSKSTRHFETAEQRERCSVWILRGALFFAIALFAIKVFAYDSKWPFTQRNAWGHDVLLFFIGLLPGLAAAFVGYAEQLAFKAQSRQFDRMRELFERALELLPKTPDPAQSERTRDVFRELGMEAMRENAEWVAIYRQRPLRPPQA